MYAVDGVIASTDANHAQKCLDIIIKGFKSLGLMINKVKTEYMIAPGPKGSLQLSSKAYTWMITGEGLSFYERANEKIMYQLCGTMTGRQNMKKHQGTKNQEMRKLSVNFWATTPQKRRVMTETTIVTPRAIPTWSLLVQRGVIIEYRRCRCLMLR